jgi:hypothetical protein
MPSIKRVPFNIDWKCFGKHSIRSMDCSNCDIEGPCIEEKSWEKRLADNDRILREDLERLVP